MATKEETRQKNTTEAANPGLNLFGGIAADIFGGPIYSRDGQYFMGELPEYVEPTNDEIREYIKTELNADPIGKNDPRFNTPETQALRDAQFAEAREALKKRFFAERGTDVSGQLAGEFGAIRDLFSQQNPFAEDFLGLTRQAAKNQQNLFGLGSDRLAELLGGGGSGFDPIVQRALTDVKESFSNMGGLFSSDAQAAGTRIASELGAGYLLDAINTAGNFGQQQLGFGSGLLDVGSQYEKLATPGGRAFSLFQNFANPQSTDFFAKGPDSSSFMNQEMRQSTGFGEAFTGSLGSSLGSSLGGVGYQGDNWSFGGQK